MAKTHTPITPALAVTALNGLAAGAYWVSPDVDNDTENADEIEAMFNIATTTIAGNNGGVDVYIAGSVDNGTTYAGGITTESDATYTPNGDDVSEWTNLERLVYTSETTARTLNKRVLIDDVPRNFKYVVYNDTDTAFNATGCSVDQNSMKRS